MENHVKLALYVGKGKIGNWVIRKWTGRQESHCELVVDELAYSSSIQDKGVRAKYIEWNPSHWKFIPIPWASKETILKHYSETKDNKYAFSSLLTSQIFNRNVDDGNADFCSEWCARALGLPNPNTYNPGTLAEFVTYLNETSCQD